MRPILWITLSIYFHYLVKGSPDLDEHSPQFIFEEHRSNLQENDTFWRKELMKSDTGTFLNESHVMAKRYADPVLKGHPKTREEMWHQSFKTNGTYMRAAQAVSLVNLLNKIAVRYLNECVPVILYDSFVERSDSIILQRLFETFPMTFLHGRVNAYNRVENPAILMSQDASCRNYVLFISDALKTRSIIGPQINNRVVVVPRSTQWKLQEFLSSPQSSDIVNLLVIGESLSADQSRERPYVLYTHHLYKDGLGSNEPIVLTSWINDKLSRPHLNLFPKKFLKGFAGHRFTVAAVNQPPFVFKRTSTDSVGNTQIQWEGVEYRILQMAASRLNFSYEIVEPRNFEKLGANPAITDEIQRRRADIGMSGVYVTNQVKDTVDMTFSHSRDCAAFITLASKALPRYRAIMGPFQWQVWLALTLTYLVAIFPLAFSDRLTLRHLIGNYGEIENMFWYVFGTFTNSLTFTGQFSWSNTKKFSTRLLIGWYWLFTIIITACYTGSIIAFVTLPIFPDTVDSVDDLIAGYYRVGTMEKGGWEYWFNNSSDKSTSRLLKNLEYVSSVEEGLNNVTKAFFWPYGFLGSRNQLEYIVQSNYSSNAFGKRSALHISDQCFALFYVSYIFPKHSVYGGRINEAIMRMVQSGLVAKVQSEVAWEMQRSSMGKLLQAGGGGSLKSSRYEDRKLTLADTEGMFLLMGCGYLVAACIFASEVIGGCTNKCRQMIRRGSINVNTLFTTHEHPTNPPNSVSNAADEPTAWNESRLNLKSATKSEGDADVSENGFGNRGNSLSLSDMDGNLIENADSVTRRRHSTIILMRSRPNSQNESDRSMSLAEDDELDYEIEAQINNISTPCRQPQLEIIEENTFGEKVSV